MNLSYELPKKIFCTFANDSIAEIELIQNEAVAIWWRSYVQNNFMGTYTQSHDPELKGDPKFKEDPVSVSMINQHIDKVEEITDTDWGIRAYDGMDHSITNSIHRMFTTSTATYQKTHLVPDSTRNFIIDKKQNEFIDHHTATTRVYKDSYNHEITHFSENRRSELQESLQSINSWIHIYEANRQYSNRSVTDKITNTIVVDIDLKNVDGSYIWAHKYEEIAQPELSVDLMHLVHTKPGANVYANKKIMGKDYFTTYFDYDNPLEWDVTNVQVLDGSFQIDYEDTYENRIESQDWKDWVAEYKLNSKSTYSNLQLGTVTNNWCNELKQYAYSNSTDKRPKDITKDPSTVTKVSEVNHIEPDWQLKDIRIE